MEFLGALEAEKLTKEKWKQYCGTPCTMSHYIFRRGNLLDLLTEELQGRDALPAPAV